LVRFHRRGADPAQRLPGEREQGNAVTEAAVARSEIEVLLADLRGQPPTVEELAGARVRLLAEYGLDPVSTRTVDAARLPGIAVVELLRRHRGIGPEALDAVTPGAAHAALAAVIQADCCYWHQLMPVPRADRHWPRR
jgi:hypothetical protein